MPQSATAKPRVAAGAAAQRFVKIAPDRRERRRQSEDECRCNGNTDGRQKDLGSAVVATLRALVAQIKQLERQIATAVREHPDGEIFLSLFEDPNSVITIAELLSAIGVCRARSRPAMRSPQTPARPRSQSSPATQESVIRLGLQQAPALRVRPRTLPAGMDDARRDRRL